MENIRVASVQFEYKPFDPDANLEIVRQFVEQASKQDVQIIAFPECCLSGYWNLRDLDRNQMLKLAEPVASGSCSQSLLRLSKDFNITIGAGLVELGDDDQLYNSYVIAMPDGQCKCHRKLHAFFNQHIKCGSSYTVFDTPHGCRVGVLICYDNNIIENARINAIMGAEILIAPHQTGGCLCRSPHAMGLVDKKLWDNRNNDPHAIENELRGPKGREWLMRWLPSRAHDNGIFLIFSNGIGIDGNEIRTGNSMILDPYGRIINETWKAGDDMVIADLDASLQPQSSGRRWMQARRPELYTPLTQPTGAEKGIREVRLGMK